MSARTTVILGLASLLMVLLGTLTVGRTPVYYAALAVLFVVLAAAVMLGSRGGGHAGRP